MSGFSFGTTAGASQSTAKPRLAGNNIYDVKFDGCELQDIQGVKDTSQLYKVLKLKFSNEDGAYEHTVFEPKAEDFTRKENEFTNKSGVKEKIPQPSNVESMMLLFKHAIDSINPTVAKQIDSNEKNLGASDWDSMRLLVAKILDVGKGVAFKIKLLKNKNGEATFPGFFTGLTKEGKPYVKNNFIGQKVAWSTYELDRIRKEENATPTPTPAFGDFNGGLAPQASAANLDMDFTVADL